MAENNDKEKPERSRAAIIIEEIESFVEKSDRKIDKTEKLERPRPWPDPPPTPRPDPFSEDVNYQVSV